MIWPLPALVTWAVAWGVLWLWRHAAWPLGGGLLLGMGVGVLAALWLGWRGASRWRQMMVALGFPLSVVATGWAAGVAPWVWLAPLVLLLAVYPLRSWRDAPLFPTPRSALTGLAQATGLPPTARLMDAGCGLGDGLLALHREFPQARLMGLEWSGLLSLLCRWRCQVKGLRVDVQCADIWAADWSGHDLVYLFQRPESMARAMSKAQAELREGAWLVSLEFQAQAWRPTHKLETVEGKPVWLYRCPLVALPTAKKGATA